MRRYARRTDKAHTLTAIKVPCVVRIRLGIRDRPRTSPTKLVLWETMGARAREIVSGWVMRSRLGDEDVGIRRFRLWHLSVINACQFIGDRSGEE